MPPDRRDQQAPPLRSVSPNITAAKITAAFYEKETPGIQNVLNWTGVTSRQETDLPCACRKPIRVM